MTARPCALAFVLAILLAGAQAAAEPLALSVQTVEMERGAPGRARLGPLTWRGGLEISSPDRRFGGLSGLLVSADGTRLTAVSDRGDWISAKLEHDGAGRLSGIGAATIAPLAGPGGAVLEGKSERDAESLARLPDGSILVAFERRHRIWRYPPGEAPLDGAPSPLPMPSPLLGAGSNSGIEALVELDDGAVLALVEGSETGGHSDAYLWRDGNWSRLRYLRPPGFRPSGAARLPDGDILVIERRFNAIDGLAIRLRRLAAASIQAEAALDGSVLAVLEPPLTVDNLEGVAVGRDALGETLIYLVSDDNFNPLQRTLLLVFALAE